MQPSTIFLRCSATTKWISHQDHNEKKKRFQNNFLFLKLDMNEQRRQIISKNTSSNGLNPYNLCIRIQHLKKACNHFDMFRQYLFWIQSISFRQQRQALFSFVFFTSLSNNGNLPKFSYEVVSRRNGGIFVSLLHLPAGHV